MTDETYGQHDLNVAANLGKLCQAVDGLNTRVGALEKEVAGLSEQVSKWRGATGLAFLIGGAVMGAIDLAIAWIKS